MASKKVTYDTVRQMGLTLNGVEDGTAYGQLALKVNGKLLACVPANKSAEPNSLAVRIDQHERAELLAAAPDVYYAPEHYLNYPMVLVRLDRVDAGVLRDILGMAHRYVTSQTAQKPTRKKPK